MSGNSHAPGPTRGACHATVAIAVALLALANCWAAAELLKNGSLSEGANGTPTNWRQEAWAKDLSRFGWEVGADGTGTLSIVSPQPNDARWCQSIAVQPGATYRVKARVRTEGVGILTAGALLAIEPRIADSPELRGTHGWDTLEVVAQAGTEATWDVCARLGSYGSLNTGTAWFTDFVVEQVHGPPRGPSWLSWTSLRAWASGRWSTVVLPLAAGLLLAFGLGVGRAARASAEHEERGRPPDPWASPLPPPPSPAPSDVEAEEPEEPFVP